MQQGRSARNVELLSRLSDPRVSDVISRAANGETMTDQDCFVLYCYMTSVFWSYEDDFLQFHLGMLDPKSWASDVPSEALARQPCLSRGLEVRAGRDR